jgi:hypothetical protein
MLCRCKWGNLSLAIVSVEVLGQPRGRDVTDEKACEEKRGRMSLALLLLSSEVDVELVVEASH